MRTTATTISAIVLSGTLAVFGAGPTRADDAVAIAPKRVLMVVAQNGFRDEELIVPCRIFQNKGVEVDIAAPTTQPAKGMLGKRVKPTKSIADAKVEDYDAIVFVGGVGARRELWQNTAALGLCRQAAKQEKLLAAICYAPCILANAGLLKGKTASVYGDRWSANVFKRSNTVRAKDDVTVDGRIVTANGPRASAEFAKQILLALTVPVDVERGE